MWGLRMDSLHLGGESRCPLSIEVTKKEKVDVGILTNVGVVNAGVNGMDL